MAEEREYWLPPYWDASELFLRMMNIVSEYGQDEGGGGRLGISYF